MCGNEFAAKKVTELLCGTCRIEEIKIKDRKRYNERRDRINAEISKQVKAVVVMCCNKPMTRLRNSAFYECEICEKIKQIHTIKGNR